MCGWLYFINFISTTNQLNTVQMINLVIDILVCIPIYYFYFHGIDGRYCLPYHCPFYLRRWARCKVCQKSIQGIWDKNITWHLQIQRNRRRRVSNWNDLFVVVLSKLIRKIQNCAHKKSRAPSKRPSISMTLFAKKWAIEFFCQKFWFINSLCV